MGNFFKIFNQATFFQDAIHLKRHRLRLYGRRTTEEEIVKEISRLLLGDDTRKQEPLSVSDAARALGYCRNSIYKYVKMAVEKYHLLEYDNNRRIVLPKNPKLKFQRFYKRIKSNRMIVKRAQIMTIICTMIYF